MAIRCAELKKKKVARLRRAEKTRVRIRKQQEFPRLAVHRSLNHIYAQIISPTGSTVLTQASSLDKKLRAEISYGGNVEAAKKVGKEVAARAIAAGIKRIAFDRSGFKYHGRIKALADAAREAGLEF